ncbi:hypothetical protein [Leifsonia sp. 71-9]|uniref:hypothetical protein n=1 Tax=Leifsonia sp. 71-9 TaxID=1895934 RepID=UPI0009268258|nr:hypothetical protein [Leifsonia sp. 71-9]OJX73982.1 MAG: hypothetical protein BGO91_17275 [Leifsonia sp. 71-9]
MNRHAAIGSPHQRVIRTVVQAVIAGVPTIVAIIGVVADQWPAEWLVATARTAVAIQGVLARIMAIPAVDAWLTGLGLGSAPRADATTPPRPPAE